MNEPFYRSRMIKKISQPGDDKFIYEVSDYQPKLSFTHLVFGLVEVHYDCRCSEGCWYH